MSESKTSAPEIPPDELQARIEEILQIVHRGEMFRGLCQLAWESNLAADQFRKLLKQARLRRSRVSEILTVFESPEALNSFLVEKKTWKDSLEVALNGKIGESERLVARLERLIEQHLPSLVDGQKLGAWTFRRTGSGLEWQKDGAVLEMLTTAAELV